MAGAVRADPSASLRAPSHPARGIVGSDLPAAACWSTAAADDTPTLIPVEKVKTLLAAQRPPSQQRERLGRWTLEHEAVEDARVDNVVEYYWSLRTLAYACSLAGHFDHDSKVKEGTKVCFSFDVSLVSTSYWYPLIKKCNRAS